VAARDSSSAIAIQMTGLRSFSGSPLTRLFDSVITKPPDLSPRLISLSSGYEYLLH
jgi:hypothetical protein